MGQDIWADANLALRAFPEDPDLSESCEMIFNTMSINAEGSVAVAFNGRQIGFTDWVHLSLVANTLLFDIQPLWQGKSLFAAGSTGRSIEVEQVARLLN